MDVWPSIILLFILVLINAFFAMSEIAIISVNTQKMKHLAEDGSRQAKQILAITDEPSDFLATIQVGVTLSGFLASAVAAANFADLFTNMLSFIPLSPDVMRSIVLIIITLVLSYFTLILGELVPKRIAMTDPDKIALKTVGTVTGMYKVCRPFVRFLAFSTNVVLKIFSINVDSEDDKVDEEDILMMVEAGEDSGAIEPHERTMIQNIFEFDDRHVSEVMTHRTDIVAVSEDDTLETVMGLAQGEKFSRFPVYREDLDDIVGTIYLKDIIPVILAEGGMQNKVKEVMRDVLYVPVSMRCSMLLRQLREGRERCAIVVDEYSGTEGLVTMEDLLEAIVGDLGDEYEGDENLDIQQITETSWLFSGDTEIEDVEHLFGKDLFDNDEFDTLNGFITGTLGRIPTEGEVIPLKSDSYVCTIMAANGRCIEQLKVEKSDIQIQTDELDAEK